MTQARSGFPQGLTWLGRYPVEQVRALLFDVFGTVVDWRSGVIRDVSALAGERGADIDAASLADRWRAAYRPAMNQVRTGELPWTNLDGLHRRTLDQLIGGTGLEGLDEAGRAWLTTCWHRLDPWPDAVAGLERLKRRYIISAFSNGNVALLVNMAKMGRPAVGLRRQRRAVPAATSPTRRPISAPPACSAWPRPR